MLSSEFEISTDRNRMNVDLIHDFLSKTYWAQGRTRDTVVRSLENSLCFGVYREQEQVAFARVITDQAVFGYLADVFVVPQFRGQGIGKALVHAIVQHEKVRMLDLILLRTKDAQDLYSQFGFQLLPRPAEMMALYPMKT